ncbi:MAG: DUF885 domain-containing protein [Actinobacteria bacterium]|nr:DUF885 domain-containing protein [Actinomycetota bacterium]
MFDRLVDGICAALWNLHPGEAVYLGKHEYDGVVPDLTGAHVEAELDRLRGLRDRLDGMDGLDAEQVIDRSQLVAAVDSTLIAWEQIRGWRVNPMTPIPLLDITLYLTRGYAPFGHRAEQAAAVLEQAPRVLDQARACLEPVVPTVFAEWAIRLATGMAESLIHDLPGEAGGDPVAAGALTDAGAAAAAALRDYAAWIETDLLPASSDAFAVGGEVLEDMLRRGELIDLDLDALLAMGEADLEANLDALHAAAAEVDSSLSPAEAYRAHVASVHPAGGDLIEAAGGMLEDIRRFLVEHHIITIPSEVRAVVAETPRHLRWAFAMMNTPGPYETGATEAFYYVTPVEPDWPPEKAEEWRNALNLYALEDISIHEAYPGHYVHFLHYDAAPTEVSRRVASYAFTEGWAHYAEQMMWEEGYRNGDPRFHMAQLAEALVRNCRFVAAISMHAHGMSLDEATRLFMDHALCDETPARAEAERGAFDPGYYSYTLGKLQILRLREDCRRAESGFDLRAFHDRLLSRGAPPVELMRKVMLSS